MKKAFPGHKVVTLEDLKKGGAKDIVEDVILHEPILFKCVSIMSRQ